ncbi:capsule biosynthesis protein [Mucilaginibacter robiniae]|uniref:Capsule biosynthesis protein n=1 Tax=Mucilaginibacter robiniae TaxID=2728022 RepID=A0A7L5E2E3_9SPHI|nr:SLBB domain-containing protein [Mucilaginibacter robiniae]QJD97550.1 capsule biosynthesis protein [Mucilaginibacter robiniae]
MKSSLRLFTIIFTFLCLSLSTSLIAQNLPQNLSAINVENLSDVQIKQILAQASSAGQDVVQYLQAKGASQTQINSFQSRIKQLNGSSSTLVPDTSSGRKLNYLPDTSEVAKPASNQGLKVFGTDLFSGRNLSFEPNLRIATPVNYVLGPDDQVNINVYGKSLVNWHLTVSPEGSINIPGVGDVNVAGKTVEEATTLIKRRMIASHYAIGSGTTVNVTLGNIRSIKVIVTGEVNRPGTYTLPSLATAFNALYQSGGPNQNGSFRQIEIIRNNRIVRRLDVYDFLLKADQKDNISLRDQDIIRVPTYRVRVQMAGQVKRPAIFEVLPGETLQNVIGFAGGFTDTAYTAKIKVIQVSNQERRISDIFEDDYSNYIPLRGDRYTVDAILNRFQNRVTINGAVFRPGEYELNPGLTLSQLITKASGLKEDAYLQRGYITRLKPDNTTESISFDLQGILAQTTPDIALKREDVITIPSLFDLRDRFTVSIKGEVRRPGDFSYAEGLTVESLIEQAGGFAEGASTKRIEVARRITTGDPMQLNSPVSKVFTVDVSNPLSLSSANFVLQPYDVVSVFTQPGFEKQRTVKIEGEVLYPGPYTIMQKDEKISDIVNRAGGLIASADPSGGTLKRTNAAILGVDKFKVDTVALERERVQRLRTLQQNVNGSSAISDDQLRNDYVGIDLETIIKKPGSKTDLLVEDGDVIRVPKKQQVVRVNGEVLYPSVIVYNGSKSFKDYIVNAGGFSSSALRRGAYVVYPNGTVKGTRKFFVFNSRPRVKPGSEIFVPKRSERRGISLGEVVGIGGSLTSLVAVVLGLISITR